MIGLLPKHDDLRDERDTALDENIARQAASGISNNDGHGSLPVEDDTGRAAHCQVTLLADSPAFVMRTGGPKSNGLRNTEAVCVMNVWI